MDDIGEYVPKTTTHIPDWFWKAKGQKQGALKNTTPSINTKYKDYTKVIGVQWGATNAVDMHSGMATGKSLLEAFVITKYVDVSTPLLMQALYSNEVITESEFIYLDYPSAKSGQGIGAANAAQMKEIFTVQGNNGFISKIDCGSTPEGRLLERVWIVFNEISWTSNIGSTAADWKRAEA